MKVTVVEYSGSGGLIHYAYQLCEAMAAEGADVELLTEENYELDHLPHAFRVEKRLRLTEPGSAKTIQRPMGRGGAVRRVVRRARRASRILRAWLEICRHLERTRPDVAQFSVVRFGFEGLFLRRLRRRGLVLAEVCHEFEPRARTGVGGALDRRLITAAYRSFSALFFLGEAPRRRFGEIHPGRWDNQHVVEIGNQELFLRRVAPDLSAKDIRGRYGLGRDDRMVLFFGNINPSKGVEDLLRAFALIPRDLGARLVVAGYPAKEFDRGALERLRDELDIAEVVTLDLRYVPLGEVGPTMEAADVAVLPYRSATASSTLQVAYAFGTPVVVSDVGALADVAGDGTGVVVPPRAPEALAAGVARLLEDPELAARMGARGRELARTKFAWSTVAGKMLATYASLTRT